MSGRSGTLRSVARHNVLSLYGVLILFPKVWPKRFFHKPLWNTHGRHQRLWRFSFCEHLYHQSRDRTETLIDIPLRSIGIESYITTEIYTFFTHIGDLLIVEYVSRILTFNIIERFEWVTFILIWYIKRKLDTKRNCLYAWKGSTRLRLSSYFFIGPVRRRLITKPSIPHSL